MKFEITQGKVSKIQFVLRLFKWSFHFIFMLYKTPNKFSSGWTSRCKDSRHILFLEYDKCVSLEELNDELKYLQDFYKLSNFYIFKAGEDSFHAICLDKFSLKDAMEIVGNSNSDYAFRLAPIYFRKRWVLRSIQKGDRFAPFYYATAVSHFNKHQKSTAHRMFLEKFYCLKIGKLKNEDGLTELDLCNYSTGNRTEAIDLKKGN